jgi:hypothetical protein
MLKQTAWKGSYAPEKQKRRRNGDLDYFLEANLEILYFLGTHLHEQLELNILECL